MLTFEFRKKKYTIDAAIEVVRAAHSILLPDGTPVGFVLSETDPPTVLAVRRIDVGTLNRGTHAVKARWSLADGYPNPKVNAVVYSGPTANFTAQDWRDLARAAIDQAGLTGRDYDQIEAVLARQEPEEEDGDGLIDF